MAMKTIYLLSSKKNKLFLFCLLFCQVVSFAQSEARIRNNASKKVFSVRLFVGGNAAKCSMKTIEDYEHVVWHDKHVLPLVWYEDYHNHSGIVGLLDSLIDSYQIPSIDHSFSPGLSVGCVGEFRINDHLAFQFNPTLYFGSQKIVYDVIMYDVDGAPLVNIYGDTHQIVEERSLRNDNWLELPLLVNYTIHGVERTYLVAGLTPRVLLAPQREMRPNSWFPYWDHLCRRSFDLAFELGAGVKVYKEISIQFKWSHGLVELLKKQGGFYDLPLQSLKSNQFQIGIVF